jgi:hypothetical protein
MSAPTYDEVEANRRLREAERVIDAARDVDGWWVRVAGLVGGRTQRATLGRLHDALAAYDAATAEDDAAATA